MIERSSELAFAAKIFCVLRWPRSRRRKEAEASVLGRGRTHLQTTDLLAPALSSRGGEGEDSAKFVGLRPPRCGVWIPVRCEATILKAALLLAALLAFANAVCGAGLTLKVAD